MSVPPSRIESECEMFSQLPNSHKVTKGFSFRRRHNIWMAKQYPLIENEIWMNERMTVVVAVDCLSVRCCCCKYYRKEGRHFSKWTRISHSQWSFVKIIHMKWSVQEAIWSKKWFVCEFVCFFENCRNKLKSFHKLF